MKRIFVIAFLCVGLFGLSSCDKYLDITPVGKVIPETASDFRALLTSAYSKFPAHKPLLALRTDELVLNTNTDELNSLKSLYLWKDANPDANATQMPYGQFYTIIFYANSVIADAEAKAGSGAEVKQMVGEAYMLRAYAHFELVNLFGKPYNASTAATDLGVPISTSIDIEQPYVRATVEQNYTQIFSDIEKARENLNQDAFEAGLNYRFTTHSVPALLARIYLYRGEWQKAYDASQECLAINNTLDDLNSASAVLPNSYLSGENIQSLENAFDASLTRSSYVSSELIARYNQQGDKRFAMYFSNSGSNRYVSLKGNSNTLKITFRNAEIYLIKAEAAARLNNLAEARTSLLALESKRLTPAYFLTQQTLVANLNQAGLISEILNEKSRELALEGHRWYDLRRTTQPQIVHQVNSESATLATGDARYTIRIPADAAISNPNL